MRGEFVKAFEKSKNPRYQIVDSPTPGSVTLQLSLLELDPSSVSGNVMRKTAALKIGLLASAASLLTKGGMSTKARILLTRVLIVLIGFWVLGWGIFYPSGGKMWDYMGVTGGIYFNAAFALLAGGLYWKRASRTGAYLALTVSFTNVIGLPPIKKALGMGQVGPDRIWLVVFLATVGAMVLGSLLFPDKDKEAAPAAA